MKQFYTLFCIVALLLWACLPSRAITQLMKLGATDKIEFLLTDASTGQIGQTGQAANVVIKISKASGAGQASAGVVTEKDGVNFPGVYLYTPAAAETNLAGILGLHVTCANCTTQDYAVQIYDPAQFGTPLPATYALNANDELALGYVFSMIDPNGGTPRYRAASLALAPTGAGGASVDPFSLPRTGVTYGTTTWGGWLNAQLAAPYAGLTTAEIASIWAAPARTLTGVVQLDLTQPLSTSQMLADTVGGGLFGGASALRKIVISGSTMTIYQADGLSVLKAFTLSPAPTAGSKQ